MQRIIQIVATYLGTFVIGSFAMGGPGEAFIWFLLWTGIIGWLWFVPAAIFTILLEATPIRIWSALVVTIVSMIIYALRVKAGLDANSVRFALSYLVPFCVIWTLFSARRCKAQRV